MNVIERYQLIDGALAKAAQDKYEKVQGVVGGGGRESGADPDTRAKGLRLELTMEDPIVFAASRAPALGYRRHWAITALANRRGMCDNLATGWRVYSQ
jgi:hypothetical protein